MPRTEPPAAAEALTSPAPSGMASQIASSLATTPASGRAADATPTTAAVRVAPMGEEPIDRHEKAQPVVQPAIVVSSEAPAKATPVSAQSTPTAAPVRSRRGRRPFLAPSAPPLETPAPSDALGHAARLAITRHYCADATDPDA